MWTPRRLLLWLVGLVFFLTLFQVYSYFLGHYDGLPPLPAEYAPSPEGADSGPVSATTRPNQAVARLVEAFGPNCEEQFRRIKLEWRLEGIVVAADRWQLLDNGQLRLHKVSVAVFGKPKPDQPGVEINTIRGEQADIEFDKPITDHRDAFNRKPIGGKLIGKGMKVELRNNRRTPNTDDDIRLYTDWLAYSDKEHRIWTHAEVRLVDGEPEQARITALGLEVVLIPTEAMPEKARKKDKDGKANEAAPRPPPIPSASSSRKSPIAGVKHVRLERDVSMNLLIDARSAFLGKPSLPSPRKSEDGAEDKPDPATRTRDRTPLVVTSRGPFSYDVENDRADFMDKVTVIRKVEQDSRNAEGKPSATRYDQMDCDHLALFIQRRKTDPGSVPSGREEPAVDLLRVEADGKPLELSSDAERLRATGTRLIYDKVKNETHLLGEPVQAERDGNELSVHGALIFTNPTGDRKEIQEARAEGRGEIRIRNLEGLQPEEEAKQASKPRYDRVARWEKEMRITREGDLDRLDFIGRASFEDPEHGRLRAEQILVWLESSSSVAPADAAASNTNRSVAGNRRPRRMDALNEVSLEARDLRITRTNYLRVQVEEAATVPGPPNSGLKSSTSEPPWKRVPDSPLPRNDKPDAGSSAARPSGPNVLPTEKDVAAEPLVLRANTVDVRVVSTESRQAQLREVRTEGQVHVTRRPTSAKDAGIEIRGDRLDLFYGDDGGVLKVSGQPAYVQLDRLKLLGPLVHIDQPANNAWINGPGSMKLPARTDFQGNSLQEPVEVTIYWTERMFFDGKVAEFDGNVQAEQGEIHLGGARLACQKLEVVLDRAVSLKEPRQREGESPPGLHRMLCDRGCRLEKGVRTGDRWEQYQRIEAREVLFDNPSSQLNVYGPGTVTMLHEGSAGGFAGELSKPGSSSASTRSNKQPMPATPDRTTPPRSTEMKLTRIRFGGHMQANRATGVVIFTDRIELTHGSGGDPEAEIDPDRLPVGGLWLACNRLRAVSRRQEDGTVAQEFEAADRVRIQGRLASGDFSGQADVVKYVESKDLLILEGHNGNLATLSRQVAPGRPREPVRAKRIWYWRGLNQVRLDETDHIQVNP
ncbi:MAG: hypothetical protein NZM31_13965 [Gemmatales bacterium]|nr:hypothetical protein [Gemmatales bacterium]MDW8388102.1 hypothetical protein [Gemmatales bacterium]